MKKNSLQEKSSSGKIPWDDVFRLLEKWLKEREKAEPAVSAVAEDYRPKGYAAWAILVSTILSLRTKDDVTRTASRALLDKAPGPKELIQLGEKETARLAYPAGFYRTKAANLQRIAAILLEKYSGLVPADMEALLSLPGVGRKTANLVLTEAFDMDGICVDIHVHRISNRLGWVKTKDPLATEMVLREELPKKYWKRINKLLVLYGQNVCRPVSPFCSSCVIKEHCPREMVGRSR
jgi:endonuclease-3